MNMIQVYAILCYLKTLLEKMLNEIESNHKKPAWKAILDGVINYVKNIGYNMSILSEYEMYYNYIKNENVYEYKKDFNYIDQSLKTFDINSENNKKYIMIADHHYQSQNNEDKVEKKIILLKNK